MGHVFISYKAEDGEFVSELVRQIEDAGFQVWPDSDRLRTEEKWREAIDQAIRDASALILVLTPASKASEQIMYEWMFALGVGVKVIVVMLQVTDLHPRLEALPCLDFTTPSALPWGKLIRQMQEVRDGERSPFGPPRPFERPSSFGGRRLPDSPPSSSFLDRLRRREQSLDDDLEDLDPPARHVESVPRLIEALEGDNRETRIAAARQLGELGDRAAVPALIKLLRDEDWRVRDAAAQALGKLKAASAVVALLETLRMGRPGPFGSGPNNTVITAAIRDIGMLAVPVLIDALDDEDWRIRLYAAEALGQISSAEALGALAASLRDPEWRVRWRAAEALGKARDVSVLPVLVDLLRDESKDVRISTAWALGQIGDSVAVPGLIKLLHDRDWRVRWAAAEALWSIGEESVPLLLEALREPDEALRRVVIRALAEIGQPAIAGLLRLLNSGDWDVRWAASAALEAMGRTAVPALVQVLEDGDWRVRWAAAEALKQIGTPEALRAVEDWQQAEPGDAARDDRAEG